MDMNHIQRQLELTQSTVKSFKEQNRIFDELLKEAVKGAPEKDKKAVQKIQLLSMEVLEHAKKGDLKKAQELIKSFKHGGQSNE